MTSFALLVWVLLQGPPLGPVPKPAQQLPAGPPNFGVELDKVRRDGSYTLSGRDVSPARAFEALIEASVPDDSKKPWIVVVGPADFREEVRKAWQESPETMDARDHFRFWSAGPEHWSATTGHQPGVTFQTWTGAVLVRESAFESAQQLNAMAKVALRKADPNYDPAKDAKLADAKAAAKAAEAAPVSPWVPQVPSGWASILISVGAAYLTIKGRPGLAALLRSLGNAISKPKDPAEPPEPPK